MFIELLKYLIFISNLILLFFTIRYYNQYHKLSSTLLIIVLLSSLFQNLEFLVHSDETKLVLQQASKISKILFSFSFLIAIIQAGTLSIKYMYLQYVRRIAWFLSFLIMFLGFFMLQPNTLDTWYFELKVYFIEIITVTLVFIIGLFSFITKKQYTLLLGSLSFFLIPLIAYFGFDLNVLFSISQISFLSFLLINEKKSIIKSKNKLT